ncbi:hypothetical protein COU17_00835 [Candidatus Kaiserbacteria bacterium CG10_big_fil_rev_8_21_14_0_10_49_17]|uniref:YdbS-like PH domain-containing protein n=1 Tax=Candidatus Kaiserbacteria bacterium CG10_big_fil_rev_8_21_14_0_10_49_17 TaxID=1974609 RepID=A0A2M6WF08_9BACT|nr:MAG: hypothetical protein COU17_00835 [Candidatus Kaiserbacteria bacterium CG10_big_fil_rev_8_21_14_0_10_49_17]
MIHLQENEEVLLRCRKHWFILLRDSLLPCIVYILPFIFIEVFPTIYTNGFRTSLPEIPATTAAFLVSLWSLLLFMKLAGIWTNYYLDIWIITDRRIIDIDQRTFFSREVATLRMERVQDVTYEIHGFIATMLNFGNIHVQTAGEESEFIARNIPNPEKVKQKILEKVDAITEDSITRARQTRA